MQNLDVTKTEAKVISRMESEGVVIRRLGEPAISTSWDCGENERQPRPQSRQPKPYRRWQTEIAEPHNVSEFDKPSDTAAGSQQRGTTRRRYSA